MHADSESARCQTSKRFGRTTVDPEAMTPKHWLGLAVAGVTAALGWIALAIEGHRSVTSTLAEGAGLAQAIFLYLRFFTILTNIGVAILMSVSCVRLMARGPLPAARLYNAGLIYILVTCVTYEVLLRSQWTPRGMQFLTDTVIHDIIPALTLVFWLGFAPRHGVRWRDVLWILAYPTAYFAMTLVAGAYGEGYPYSFVDVDRIGMSRVLIVAALFLAVFAALGVVTSAVSMRLARKRTSSGVGCRADRQIDEL